MCSQTKSQPSWSLPSGRAHRVMHLPRGSQVLVAAVGTDAYSIEKGLLRFEAYQVIGEDALIIHETFKNSDELKFHLSKGTAEKYKKDIDKIVAPEAYYFRGPVSWTIRTYSKFLHLPTTYSSQRKQLHSTRRKYE